MFPYIKFPIHTKYIFFNTLGDETKQFNYSTDLEKVGIIWDVSIKNGTGVSVVSEPVTIDTTKYGLITLVKVRADVATDYHTIIKELWVPTNCIHERQIDESQSSQLSN